MINQSQRKVMAGIGCFFFLLVMRMGGYVFGGSANDSLEAIQLRMQAENELLADQLAALPETEFWVMVNHRLHDCEAEAAAVYRGGACPDFTVDINEIRAGSAGKMQQRAEATEKLLKLHKHQLAIKTDRGTSGSSRTVHRAGIVESASALTKVLTHAEGR